MSRLPRAFGLVLSMSLVVGCDETPAGGGGAPDASTVVDCNAVLRSGNQTGADLHGCDFRGIHFGTVVFDAANLADADFSGDDLHGASFTIANLEGTKFEGAFFAKVRSGNVRGTPASLPTGFTLTNGFLVGPQAYLGFATLANTDLSGRDLHGVDLINANLRNANLSGADLSGADFTNADLTGATLTGAALTGATWLGTHCPDGSLTSTPCP